MKRLAISLLTIACATAHASDYVTEPDPMPAPAPIAIEREVSTLDAQIALMRERVGALETLEVVGFIDPCPGPECDDVSTVEIEPLPNPADRRAPLFDGGHGDYVARKFDKTVDWRDGVPLWDDSISHYRDHNFDDWYTPYEPYYIGYDANVASQVEEVLTPFRPKSNIWGLGLREPAPLAAGAAVPDNVQIVDNSDKYAARDLTCMVDQVFGKQDNDPVIELTDGCPFETPAECDIWRKKPMVSEAVAPRSPAIRADKMAIFVAAAKYNPGMPATDSAAAPLLDRYKMLMASARACCTDGMATSLRDAGATEGLIYKFLSDDANFYNFGARCLMMTDADLDQKYPNTATAAIAADVRNGCLCRGRQWYRAMLAPFQTAYDAVPQFANSKFFYSYTDGLGRTVETSVNTDVKNVMQQLDMCP